MKAMKELLQPFGTALLLAGMVAVSTGLIASPAAIAATANQPVLDNHVAAAPIPPTILNTLRQDLSRRTNLPPGQLRLVETSRQTWSNGCLGLARPGEVCTQAMVDGWRVVFAHGKRRWVYRTDMRGRNYRLQG